ncbi:hypothetical protein [Aeromicrobium sp. Root472D3]|uniref:hypothetical protein n=1 Tax=Aeromicrobium sp. Root472D3 TaxID=1736540 RepID=UPI0006F2CDF6|nr:hypothetical protein [Aeromicrobium sp. Root472D3]KQX74276.1 hypothetical protein ASD10_03240 [Aeromicrobium sp. Root472D3]
METVLWVTLVIVGVNVLVVAALFAHYVRERRSDDDNQAARMVDLAERFETFSQRRDSIAA